MSGSTAPSPPTAAARTLALVAVVAAVVAGLCAVGRSLGSAGAVAEEPPVRAVLDAQVAAWNRGDLDAFMDGYWRDDRLTFTSGDSVERGWEKTRERYVRRYKSEGKEMGRLSFTELEIEGLNAETALARGRYLLALKSGMSTGRFTLVFRKFPDGWKITSDHTSAGEKPGAG